MRRRTPPSHLAILTPYSPGEALAPVEAARVAGIHHSTVRDWAGKYGLGRKIGACWKISSVALLMHLQGDQDALVAYHSGDRGSERVLRYFDRAGVRVEARS